MAGTHYEIHTQNMGLVGRPFFPDWRSDERVPFVFDRSVPDWQWRLFADGQPAGKVHDIGEHVASDVRRAIQHHQGKNAGVVTTPEADKNPLAPSTLSEEPIREGQPPAAAFSPKGDQFVWRF